MADDKTTNGELCDDDELKADEYKLQANQFFKDGKYDEALSLYTKAIDLNPQVPAYYGNRSFCYIKTEYYGSALEDANKAIDLDKKYIKAYYRRASAYMALGKFKLSLKDYEMVTKFRPKDKDASLKYQECKKIVQRQAFEKAIAVDEKKSVASTVDLNSMVVEDEYDGPRLSENGVTEEFVGDLIERFTNQKKIHKKYAYEILLEVKKIFEKQPSMVDISIPENGKLTVCGDIHGQFYDLLNIFNLNGNPSAENPYLFNGDFVDRGSFSCEVIFTLFSFKLLYPDHFFMSRGNHESAYMNQMFGFEGEVKSKYTSDMADLFTEVYNWLPLCHLINEKVLSFENCYKALDCNGHSQENEDFEANNLFKNGKKYLKIVKASKKILPSHFQSEVMHGGLFKRDDVKLEELRTIDRNRQPGEEGLMCELLWSDPQPQPGRSPSKRGCGIHFGPDVTKEFCKSNDLEYIVRSHEVKPEGYEVVHDGKCITVFSAPNYCDQMGNKGAFITMGSDVKPNFTSYDAVPHPDVKPMAYANSFMSMFGFM